MHDGRDDRHGRGPGMEEATDMEDGQALMRGHAW